MASDARLSAKIASRRNSHRADSSAKKPKPLAKRGLACRLLYAGSCRRASGGTRAPTDRWKAQQTTRAESEDTRATLAFQELRDCLPDRFMRRYRTARCACRPTGQDSVARVEERFGCGSDLVGGRGAVSRRESEVRPVPRPTTMRVPLPGQNDPFSRFEPNGITSRSKLAVIAKRIEKLRFHDGC